MIGIDLGGTNLRAAFIGTGGTILCSRRATTGPKMTVPQLVERIDRICQDLCAEAENKADVIGIGIPGILGAGGVVRISPNLPQLNGVHLTKLVAERVGCQVYALNDADAIAWGEAQFGAGVDFVSFVTVTLGTGVGGGLILNRQLWQGSLEGAAGEIGHFTVDPAGRLCGCGNRGCLEAYASAAGIVRTYRETLLQEQRPLPDGEVTAAQIAAAAHRGDPLARLAFVTAGQKLSLALSGIINLLNPDAIVFAGGTSQSLDLMLPTMVQELATRSFVFARRNIPLVRGLLGDNAGILGAAELASRQVSFITSPQFDRQFLQNMFTSPPQRGSLLMMNQEELEAKEIYRMIIFATPEAILDEVLELLGENFSEEDRSVLCKAYFSALRIYRGDWPGYQPCNTEYHNLFHATHTFLALARLIHGSILENSPYASKEILIALCAAVFHDAGYLQEVGDEGSGAKYTREHVPRGIRLFSSLAPKWGMTSNDLEAVSALIQATDLGMPYSEITFPSHRLEFLAQLLDGADLTTQMSDRTYLEKLLFLYHEFREAGIDFYDNEADLLRKTTDFYAMIDQRLAQISPSMDLFFRAHFRFRYGYPLNPYQESIRRQKRYLEQIVSVPGVEPQQFLKRDGIVDRVRSLYNQRKQTQESV